jgi:uncharacterized protein (DUF2336 family)
MTQSVKRKPDGRLETLDSRMALELLESRAREAQEVLARRGDAGADVLHYLATHGAAATRAAVAANPGAGPLTDRLLADDGDAEVRAELAAKIGRLLPGLSEAENEQVFALTVETLECLARDAAVRVRVVLAEAIKHLTCVPHDVVRRLAEDAEALVAVPILEYSPLLSDADLMEIIACAQTGAALAAVARRTPVGEEVSDAIVKTLDIPAVATLLVNPDARIRKEAMDRILDEAEEVDDWHLPLTLRTDLSPRAIRRIAGFVGAGLIEKLAERNDLSDTTRQHLSRELRARLAEGPALAGASTEAGRAPDLVTSAKAAGKLDAIFLEQAIQSGNRELVTLALAELAGVPDAKVRRILAARNAKPVVALVWHAHLPMRTAFKLQTYMMRLPAHELLPARGGVHFPLSKEEMRWHLDYFDIAI